MSMEDKMYDALARNMLLPSSDQYGNFVDSPLRLALSRWASENQIPIAEKLLEKISVEVLADAVEKRVKDAISIGSTDRYLSGYDRNNYQEKLNTLILDKVATLIANKKLEEFIKQDSSVK